MTELGILHLGSLIFLSGAICFAISVNENRDSKTIVRETVRRWVKFLGFTFVIAIAVHLMSL